MINKLAVIGIDSLDPHVLLNYRKELPTFSKLMTESPTFVSRSIFPVDTIPAWASIYTGLHPGNHGLLYVYDVFDPTLSDLKKLDITRIRGRTFWDYAGRAGYRTAVVYPLLLYPSWELNGIMVSKSPFDRRVDWIKTDVDVDVYPPSIKARYGIPDTLGGLWGGFPGVKHLEKWAEQGKIMLAKENDIGFEMYKHEKWDLFFIYFSVLDIIQHRLWRFFDEHDPTYLKNDLSTIILDYYKLFDALTGTFIELYPDVSLIVMSDHGHRSRPYKTVNINEHLRRSGILVPKGHNKIMSQIRRTILEVADRLHIEGLLIKLVVTSQSLTRVGKSVYSSAGSIDTAKSKAWLSNFAGIKSYPHGGIEINRDIVSDTEYEKVREELIKSLSELEGTDGEPLMDWVLRREDVYPGEFTEKLYPDIVFALKEEYGVGWDLYSDLFGKAYDHQVASGGHARDTVFLIRNVTRELMRNEISILDVAPTILDLLDIDWRGFDFDGESIFS
jgi:predicted AlkP superfamily phosphohydrolase/phosphomutase